MKNQVPHLHRDRHGTYYFRVSLGGRTIKRSLRTKAVELATMRAACLNLEWDAMSRPNEPTVEEIAKAFKQGSTRRLDLVYGADGEVQLRNINSDDDARRAKDILASFPKLAIDVARNIDSVGAIAPEDQPATPAARAKLGALFSKSADAYLGELETAELHKQKNVSDKEKTYIDFLSIFGDLRMGEVDKKMIAEFKREMLASCEAGRVNTKVSHLSALFDWATDNGYAESNPAKGSRIGRKSELMPKVQSYLHFSEEELALIFNAEPYADYAWKKPHFHWMPLLLLYSGARPEEIASLRLDQVRKEGSVAYFALRSGKNSNSVRMVPLHRVVRESAFLDYVKERREEDPEGMLFPELRPSKNGYSKNVARRFNETYLPELRIDDPRKRLYSFRSTFITRMAENNVHPAMLMAIVGHYEQSAVDLSSPHFKNYQKGRKRITALQDTVDLFDIEVPMKF